MTAAVSSQTIHDLTPKGLFPKVAHANQNSKCLSVARVIQELTAPLDMKTISQEALQENADEKLAFIKTNKKISLQDAKDIAFRLGSNGVSIKTAKEYISHRLTPTDIARWTIIPT